MRRNVKGMMAFGISIFGCVYLIMIYGSVPKIGTSSIIHVVPHPAVGFPSVQPKPNIAQENTSFENMSDPGAADPDLKAPADNAQAATVKPAVPVMEFSEPCPVQQTCEEGQFSYFVQSGKGIRDAFPVICYNNMLVLGNKGDTQRAFRGANVVVVHPDLKRVVDVRNFDLYDSVDNCVDMTRYLSATLEWKTIVMIASHDDMSSGMCKSLRAMLNSYGSSKIMDIKFRESWAFVGEKGLPGSLGFEKLEKVEGDKAFPIRQANVSGCASYPISKKWVNVDTDMGYTLENCGITRCGFDEMEIHIATESLGVKSPKICISGQYYFYPGLLGGRGFNLIVLDPVTKTVIRTAQYDTYKTESSRLELFLENVEPKYYLMVVVSDDGSVSLKDHARKLLKEFGFDGDVIKMRTSLYFIGQKGLKQTAFSKVSQPSSPEAWPAVINERFCLPTELQDATESAEANKAREAFCMNHDSFADFCFVHHKSLHLKPKAPVPESEAIKEVFDVPILVLAGLNNIALSHTLQSILLQPGVKPQNVFVAYSVMFGADYNDFIKLFAFNPIEIPAISKYSVFVAQAFNEFWKRNPSAEYVIVIDEEIVAQPGFIWFMGYALQQMKSDTTLGGACAWNPQGFSSLASDPAAVFLSEQFTGLAFIITKEFYSKKISAKESSCCGNRSVQLWFRNEAPGFTFLVPEISRASYFSSTAYVTHLHPIPFIAFSQPRASLRADLATSRLSLEKLSNEAVQDTLKNSYWLNEQMVKVCRTKDKPGVASLMAAFLPANRTAAILFYQQSSQDFNALEHLYSCFGLMYIDGFPPFGLYKGLTSFSMNGTRMYLVGTESEFYSAEVKKISPPMFTLTSSS